MDSKVIGRAQVEQVLLKTVNKKVHLLSFELLPFKTIVGFNGDHYTLKVHYVENTVAAEAKETTFFVKMVPEKEFQRSFMLDRGMFAKEQEIYLKLLPMMAKALGRRLPVAKCYLTSDDEFMIFEDLGTKGFQLANKLDFLPLAECKAAFKAIAMLHAGSLAVEIKTGKLMVYHGEHCYEALIADIKSNDIISREWHRSSLRLVLELLQKMQCFKSRLVDVNWDTVFERLDLAWEQCAVMANGNSSTFRNVISHGDMWVNNVLFRGPSEAVLVDFQIYRYAPPMIDLLMFLHCTSSRQFRMEHQAAVIELYYNTMAEYLAQAGIREEEIPISLSQLQKSALEFKTFGIVIAARYLLVVLLQGLEEENKIVSEENGSKKEHSDTILEAFESGEAGHKFEERVIDCLNDLIEHMEL